jgi:protein-tyrosine phosphatase
MTGVSSRSRLSYAAAFAMIGGLAAVAAARAGSAVGQAILAWFAANAMMLSLAYFMNWPWIFGKTERGTFRWLPALLMAPILLFVRIVWRLQNLFYRTPLYNEIRPDLFVGRICRFGSLPGGISLIVDLTAEFPTPRSLRAKIQTVCLPTLDGCAPDWVKCQQAFELLGASHRRIYVFCANGHGRSVTFAAAWLGQQGICHSASEAVALIQIARPSARPDRDQLSFLTQVYPLMTPQSASEPSARD